MNVEEATAHIGREVNYVDPDGEIMYSNMILHDVECCGESALAKIWYTTNTTAVIVVGLEGIELSGENQ